MPASNLFTLTNERAQALVRLGALGRMGGGIELMPGRHRIRPRDLDRGWSTLLIPGHVELDYMPVGDSVTGHWALTMCLYLPRLLPLPEVSVPARYRIGLGCRSGGHGPKRKGPGRGKRGKNKGQRTFAESHGLEPEAPEVCPRCCHTRNALVWCTHRPGDEFAAPDVVRIVPPPRDNAVRELCLPEVAKARSVDDDGYDRACELVDARLVELGIT